jgi:hypothetical protein
MFGSMKREETVGFPEESPPEALDQGAGRAYRQHR